MSAGQFCFHGIGLIDLLRVLTENEGQTRAKLIRGLHMLPVQYAYWSALLCALLVNAVLSSSAAAQDMDCPDFQYQEDAQEYFESKGGSLWFNADLLDEDGDGIACELNPHRPPWPTPVPTSLPTRVPAPTAISTTVPSQTPDSNQLSD